MEKNGKKEAKKTGDFDVFWFFLCLSLFWRGFVVFCFTKVPNPHWNNHFSASVFLQKVSFFCHNQKHKPPFTQPLLLDKKASKYPPLKQPLFCLFLCKKVSFFVQPKTSKPPFIQPLLLDKKASNYPHWNNHFFACFCVKRWVFLYSQKPANPPSYNHFCQTKIISLRSKPPLKQPLFCVFLRVFVQKVSFVCFNGGFGLLCLTEVAVWRGVCGFWLWLKKLTFLHNKQAKKWLFQWGFGLFCLTEVAVWRGLSCFWLYLKILTFLHTKTSNKVVVSMGVWVFCLTKKKLSEHPFLWFANHVQAPAALVGAINQPLKQNFCVQMGSSIQKGLFQVGFFSPFVGQIL